MRPLAAFVLLALLGASVGPLVAASPKDCCPMGGGMSCCPSGNAPEAGCGLRRCAPDGESGVVPQFPSAILASDTVVLPLTDSRPLPMTLSVSPESIPPDPLFPPPRA